MPGKLAVSFVDYSKENTTVNCWLPVYTAVNFVAQEALVATLVTAINGVTLLNQWRDQRAINIIATPKVFPADVNAQREKKWLVRSVDDVTGKPVNFEIGGADLALLSAASDVMIITAGAGLALVNAIEAVVTSDVGNAISVLDIVFVGRNI